MKELKFHFSFTSKERHYTELLNAISRACGASFVGMAGFAPRYPKNQSWPRKRVACNPGGRHGHISETVSGRFENCSWHM